MDSVQRLPTLRVAHWYAGTSISLWSSALCQRCNALKLPRWRRAVSVRRDNPLLALLLFFAAAIAGGLSLVSPAEAAEAKAAEVPAAEMAAAQPAASATPVPAINAAAVYAEKCAACHGDRGQGTPDYKTALMGDKSRGELTDLIDKTMPEGVPEDCRGAEAAAVANYIYDTFYSEAAQLRAAPPRIELSRLTVQQYETVMADLVESFTAKGNWNADRGLTGEYFKEHVTGNQGKVFERVDPKIDFNFGEKSPEPGKLDDKQFGLMWQGGLYVTETGTYEFVIETANGFRLWVNNDQIPLIDAAVKSGDLSTYRESVRLLGGRIYPIKVEWFKTKRDKTAEIHLKWKRPHHVEEIVPTERLSPHRFPAQFVVNTPFPPDDRSEGYERGTSISKAWDEATTFAAIELAGYLVPKIDRFADVKRDKSNREVQIRAFCKRFAELAFRRPLSNEEQKFFIDRQIEEAGSLDAGLKRILLLVLKSPRFLYHEVGRPQDDAYTIASRLSFTLWDSIPDQTLRDAAARNQLSNAGQIRKQAERMVTNLRTQQKMRDFLHGWLQWSRFHEIARDEKLFPHFNETIVSDLRSSLDQSLDEIVWGDNPDFRRLLLDQELFLNGRLAHFYGVELPEDAAFQKVALQSQERAGVLTHPYTLTGLAYYSATSPIHRGVFVSRSVLGRSLKPPPEAVSPVAPDLHPSLTTRERVQLQTSPLTCQGCHAMINPLGFALERFDAVGRFREQDREKPIDAAGHYRTQADEMIAFTGARPLGEFLASSPETHEAFIEQLFNYFVKQPLPAYGRDRLPVLRQDFAGHSFNLRHLLVEIATLAALPESK